MSITYYASNPILDYNFGNTAYTPPATLYMGLSTTQIYASGSGATEPNSGSAYARVAITNDKTSFSVSASGSLTNLNDITFPESTGAWGTITYVGLWSASSSGSVWFYQALPSSKIVQTNTIVTFSASALQISMVN